MCAFLGHAWPFVVGHADMKNRPATEGAAAFLRLSSRPIRRTVLRRRPSRFGRLERALKTSKKEAPLRTVVTPLEASLVTPFFPEGALVALAEEEDGTGQ